MTPRSSGLISTGEGGPAALLAASGVLGSVLGLAVAAVSGVGLFLPVLSGLLLTVGFMAVWASGRDHARREGLTYQDVGGLLVFAGFAAALMSDSSQVLTGASGPVLVLR